MGMHYDPAKVPCDDNFASRAVHMRACKPSIVGPGGRTTNIENNERGILDASVFAYMNPKMAELGSDHDSQKQGIYRTNSMGDND